MKLVDFDEATHTYKVGGVPVPSVTQVLADLSVMRHVDPAVLAGAALRGKLVHKAVELWNQNDLDEASVGEDIAGYLEAWRRFCRDFNFTYTGGEKPMASLRWNFAGTPDVWGWWKRRKNFRDTRVLIDVKSGLADPVHGPQTAAYVELCFENGAILRGKEPDRAVVYLEPQGFYKHEELSDRADWSVFVSALTCFRFKQANGVA